MAKKNEFIFNIGFNRENPDHVKVAGLLNRLGHGKAEYLAKAVLAYESQGMEPMETSVGIDYQELERVVRKILEKQNWEGLKAGERQTKESIDNDSFDTKKHDRMIEEDDITGIFMALEGFRK